MTGRGIDQVLARPSDPILYEHHVLDARDYVRLAERAHGAIAAPVPPQYIWGDALPVMQRGDIDLRIVNLETAVTSSDEAWPDKGINYRMHPANVACLTAAHVDACSLANNHVLDWDRAGLVETLAVLHGAGLRTVGAGCDIEDATRPVAFDRPDGARVLVFSFALASSGVPDEWAATSRRAGVAFLPDLSLASLQDVQQAIATHRQPRDVVIVSLHWGGNWGLDVPREHRAFARGLIAGGSADVVHGHSSHHPLPLEVHRGKLILYGCGDLINDYEGIAAHGSLRCDVGCLYIASIDANGTLSQLQLVPLQLCRFRLENADAKARAWLERVFNEGGREFGTHIEARPDGSWQLHWPAGPVTP